jgi:drug/metabolite transporter (DMT)-like permease
MATSMSRAGGGGAPRWQVLAALGIVYLVWGSTYMAIRVMVEDIPPLLAAGLRFALAGLLLAGVLLVVGGRVRLKASPREAASASLIGVLILVGGIGLLTVAERDAPSGVAALVIASVPLWVLILRAMLGDPPRVRTIVGVGSGLVGVALVVGAASNLDVRPWALATLVTAAILTALGAVLSPRLAMPSDAFTATMYEMLTAGAVLSLAGLVAGEVDNLHIATLPAKAVAAFAYLVVLGSLVAYTAFVWLLDHASVSLVATYAYVNPAVAVALGWMVLGESLTLLIALGMVVVLGSVAVTSGERAA